VVLTVGGLLVLIAIFAAVIKGGRKKTNVPGSAIKNRARGRVELEDELEVEGLIA
jgi:hypothetical protein